MATPTISFTVLSPDRLQRSVWVVVDPRDVATGRRTDVPLRVRIRDVSSVPIAGRSGVYCFTDLGLPAGAYVVAVEPVGRDRDRLFDAEQGFVLEEIPVPGQPLRRNPVQIDLLPRPAYVFGDGATLARGRLLRTSDSTGLAGARVALVLETVDEGVRGRTDERGAFVVPLPTAAPEDLEAAVLKEFDFQLRFEVDGQPPLLTAQQIVREGTTISLDDILFPGV